MMKLSRKNMFLVSFMLFSLFFGAGNLIFPPFLGQNAGSQTPWAILGFLVTAVVLPVLGVIVVAKFDGLEKLASKVNPKFALIFTVLIYLSIGPGLGIPRAASVPFELAIAPYLPEGASFSRFMLLYSLVFFVIALWLSLSPNKLVNRVGKFLTPTLLILITSLFVCFLFKGNSAVAEPQVAYQSGSILTGFLEGYQTMDTIAALNFGLVIASTLQSLKVTEKNDIMHYTVRAGLIAGTILAAIYLILSYMGMQTSGVYPIQGNGAWTLRCIVNQLFGDMGGFLLALIFTLACLTTCVGLITSISQYFSTLTKKISYRQWVFMIVGFSFIVCNMGLNSILSISVPVLNAIYPVSIALIILGLLDGKLKDNKYVYPLTIAAVGFISIVYSLDQMNISMGWLTKVCHFLPLYKFGMSWIVVAIVAVGVAMLFKGEREKKVQN